MHDLIPSQNRLRPEASVASGPVPIGSDLSDGVLFLEGSASLSYSRITGTWFVYCIMLTYSIITCYSIIVLSLSHSSDYFTVYLIHTFLMYIMTTLSLCFFLLHRHPDEYRVCRDSPW